MCTNGITVHNNADNNAINGLIDTTTLINREPQKSYKITTYIIFLQVTTIYG